MMPLATVLATLVNTGNVSLPVAAAPVVRPVPTMAADSGSPIRVAAPHRTTLIPRSCGAASGSYDVLIHFHGVETAVVPAYVESGLKSVLVVVNLGEFSGPYESQFAEGGSLIRLIDQVKLTVKKHCPSSHLGRVALSAWSGGYGAVYRILTREAEANRVDAVLLADGLHAGFSERRTHQINALQMAPFVRFSGQAARGDKLLGITHTEIGTSYASTTETANYLLRANGVVRTELEESGPRPGMTLTSRAAEQGLRVFGYRGSDQRAHCDHLRALGETLFPLLAERWMGAAEQVDPEPVIGPPLPPVAVARPLIVAAVGASVSPLTSLDDADPSEPSIPTSTEKQLMRAALTRPWAPSSPAPEHPGGPGGATGEDPAAGNRESVLPDWLA